VKVGARLLSAALPLFVSLALLSPGCGGGSSPAPEILGPGCGNGVLEGGEECDDGNASNADACLVSCYTPVRFVASDPHLHSRGCESFTTSPAGLLQLLAAEGIDVGAALVWGVGYNGDLPLFTGSDDPASGGGRILHYDLEVSAFAAGRSGHLVALGLRDLDFSSDPFRFPKTGLSIPTWAKAQGERVVVGMAHGQFWPEAGFPSPPVACCMPWEFPIQAARSEVSFLITERRGDGPPVDAGTFLLWRTLLNSGFRIALLGASDYPCIHREIDDTSPRTDVIVNGPLTYDAWLEGLRRGRTVVTLDARHRLNLRVNGAPLGGEVTARAGEVLLVSVESEAPEVTAVELLVNGAPATSVVLPPGRQVATLRLGLPASSWVAARTRRSTTGAIYVVVDGKPVRASASDTCYLVRYTDHLSGLVGSGQLDLAEDTGEALDAYAAARAELEKRFGEAGGQACF
jgi:cysteine-rich repeat protein